MPTNDEAQKRRNLDHLSRFETHWEGLGVDFADFFPCLLRLRYRGLDRKVRTTARLFPGGKVYASEAEWFNAADHYSEFLAEFQTYRLTKRRRALRIYGGGSRPPEDKMGGPYIFDIRPIRQGRKAHR